MGRGASWEVSGLLDSEPANDQGAFLAGVHHSARWNQSQTHEIFFPWPNHLSGKSLCGLDFIHLECSEKCRGSPNIKLHFTPYNRLFEDVHPIQAEALESQETQGLLVQQSGARRRI